MPLRRWSGGGTDVRFVVRVHLTARVPWPGGAGAQAARGRAPGRTRAGAPTGRGQCGRRPGRGPRARSGGAARMPCEGAARVPGRVGGAGGDRRAGVGPRRGMPCGCPARTPRGCHADAQQRWLAGGRRGLCACALARRGGVGATGGCPSDLRGEPRGCPAAWLAGDRWGACAGALARRDEVGGDRSAAVGPASGDAAPVPGRVARGRQAGPCVGPGPAGSVGSRGRSGRSARWGRCRIRQPCAGAPEVRRIHPAGSGSAGAGCRVGWGEPLGRVGAYRERVGAEMGRARFLWVGTGLKGEVGGVTSP